MTLVDGWEVQGEPGGDRSGLVRIYLTFDGVTHHLQMSSMSAKELGTELIAEAGWAIGESWGDDEGVQK